MMTSKRFKPSRLSISLMTHHRSLEFTPDDSYPEAYFDLNTQLRATQNFSAVSSNPMNNPGLRHP
jgi:hypothetical protein